MYGYTNSTGGRPTPNGELFRESCWPLHYGLPQSLPLEQRFKLDRDWKRQQADHSYAEVKKTMTYTLGFQVHNKTIRKQVTDLKAVNTSLRSQVEESKSLMDNLTNYKGNLEEDKLRELLMLRWGINGGAVNLEEGKKFLNDFIDTEDGGWS